MYTAYSEVPVRRGANRRKKKLRRILKRVRIGAGVALLLALILVCAWFGADILGRMYGLGGGAALLDALPAITGQAQNGAGATATPAAAGTPGQSIRLNVPAALQTPELQNGCEATSLAMVLQYLGHSVDKVEAAYGYIPREDFTGEGEQRYGPWPGDAYPGDPGTSKGFYCYAGPVAGGGNAFLSAVGAGGRFVDATGDSLESMKASLDEGYPVILWVTLEYTSELKYMDFSWQTPDGRSYIPYSNLHCVVLTGYEAGDNFYRLCDPLVGEIEVDAGQLAASYEAMGSRAVVYQP